MEIPQIIILKYRSIKAHSIYKAMPLAITSSTINFYISVLDCSRKFWQRTSSTPHIIRGKCIKRLEYIFR